MPLVAHRNEAHVSVALEAFPQPLVVGRAERDDDDGARWGELSSPDHHPPTSIVHAREMQLSLISSGKKKEKRSSRDLFRDRSCFTSYLQPQW